MKCRVIDYVVSYRHFYILVSGEHGAACKNPETRNQAATGSPSTTVLRLLLPYSIPKVVDFEVEAGVGKVVTHVIELLLQLDILQEFAFTE